MKPKRIIVMRHAESAEDIDKSVYAHTQDLDIALSPNGTEQVRDCVPQLLEHLDGFRMHFFISPGVRLRQTYDLITERLPSDVTASFSVETLLLKQFWGDVTVENRRAIEIERYKEGVLVYRFPNGESGAQLVQRFKLFSENLKREFLRDDFPENIVILTHGFEMRIFLMVWLGWSAEYFERLANPRNCEMVCLSIGEEGSYALQGSPRLYDPARNPLHVSRS